MRELIITSDARFWAPRWPVWTATSLVVHAAVLALLFVVIPSESHFRSGSTVIPVHLVAASRPHVSVKRPARVQSAKRMKIRPRSQVMAMIGLHHKHRRRVAVLTHPRVLHRTLVHRRELLAKAKTVSKRPPMPVARSAPVSPSAIAEVSSHNLDLVRKHLERFKFYPEDARRRRIGGNVDVRFRLTQGGRAVQVKIASSSGYALLDRAAEDIVARAVPFPVDSGKYRVRLRFWP